MSEYPCRYPRVTHEPKASAFWQLVRVAVVALGFAGLMWVIGLGFDRLEKRAQWESEKQGEQVVSELKRIRGSVEGALGGSGPRSVRHP